MKTMRWQTYVLTGIVLCMVACKEVAIVHDLNERDANEIVVMLSANQIKVTKVKEEKNQEVSWSIQVSEADQIRAQNILVSNNLPKVRQGGLEGICKDAGVIVTEETEKCRKLLAYKGEIINSLETIPGVVSADVVLTIPDKKIFHDPNRAEARPTAAVTIKYLTDARVRTSLSEQKVQEFVANSITGMDPHDVTVIISDIQLTGTVDGLNPGMQSPEKAGEADGAVKQVVSDSPSSDGDTVSVFGIAVSAESAARVKMYAVLTVLTLLLLAGLSVFVLWRLAQVRKRAQAEQAESAESNKLLKGAS